MKRAAILIPLLITAVFTGCETNDPARTILKINFEAVRNTINPVMKLRSTAGEGIMIDTAIMFLERITLLQKDSTATSSVYLEGPYLIDLIYKKSIPEVIATEITAGIYGRVQAMLSIPAGYKYSIYVTGTYTLNDQWWRLRYECIEEKVFSIESPQEIEITENLPNNIWILIDVVKLFDGVDFSNAIKSPDNTIIINNTQNKNLASIIEGNFSASAIIAGEGSEDPESSDESGDDSSGDDGSSDNGDQDDEETDDDKQGSSGSDKEKDKEKDKDKDKDKNKDKNKDKDKDKNKN